MLLCPRSAHFSRGQQHFVSYQASSVSVTVRLLASAVVFRFIKVSSQESTRGLLTATWLIDTTSPERRDVQQPHNQSFYKKQNHKYKSKKKKKKSLKDNRHSYQIKSFKTICWKSETSVYKTFKNHIYNSLRVNTQT